MTVRINVIGDPVPQGNHRINAAGNRIYDTAGSRLTMWREQIAWTARYRYRGAPLEGPIILSLHFTIRRPQRPRHERPVTRPDLSKLTRAVEDALTGVLWHDDSQIVALIANKNYGDMPGVRIHARPAGEDDAA